MRGSLLAPANTQPIQHGTVQEQTRRINPRRHGGFVSARTVLYGPAKDAWPVQSNSENPDHDKYPAILLASFPGFMLPKQPYQDFYTDPPIPCSKDVSSLMRASKAALPAGSQKATVGK